MNYLKYFRDYTKIYCPHCKSVYIEDFDINNFGKRKPVEGIKICKKCNKRFSVKASVKMIYTYSTKPF